MSTLAVGYASASVNLHKSSSFDWEDMIEKAKTFAGDDDELFGFIEDILKDSKFLSNPKGFIAEWKEGRGDTEDTARTFFDENFKF